MPSGPACGEHRVLSHRSDEPGDHRVGPRLQLRMKARGHDRTFLHQHRVITAGGKHVAADSHPGDTRSADKRAGGAGREHRGIQDKGARVKLPAIAVSHHRDGQERVTALDGILDLLGQKNHAGTGRKHRQPAAQHLAQRLPQTIDIEQFQHRRTLAPGKDQSPQRI